MRISYERGGLNESDFLGADPLLIWDSWFKAAVDGKVGRLNPAYGRGSDLYDFRFARSLIQYPLHDLCRFARSLTPSPSHLPMNLAGHL